MAENHKTTELTVKFNTIKYRLWDRDINCATIRYRLWGRYKLCHIQNMKMRMKN